MPRPRKIREENFDDTEGGENEDEREQQEEEAFGADGPEEGEENGSQMEEDSEGDAEQRESMGEENEGDGLTFTDTPRATPLFPDEPSSGISIELPPPEDERRGGVNTLEGARRKLINATKRMGSKKKKKDINEILAADVPDFEADLTDIERILLEIHERGESEGWHWSVHRISPLTTPMGVRVSGFIQNFPMDYNLSDIEQILARHCGGERYRVSLRHRGRVRAATILEIPGPAKNPDRSTFDQYLDEEDMSNGKGNKRDAEREDLIREMERTRAERDALEKKLEADRVDGTYRDMFTNVMNEIKEMKMQQNRVKPVSFESIASIIAAAAPMVTATIAAIAGKGEGGSDKALSRLESKLEQQNTQQMIEAIKTIAEKKEDTISKAIMTKLLEKGLNSSDPASKVLDEVLPRVVKKMWDMKLEGMGGGEGESGEFSWKDVFQSVAEIFKARMGGMMPQGMGMPGMMPNMMPQMQPMPQPMPPSGMGAPPAGFRQATVPQDNAPIPQQAAEEESADIQLAPEVIETAIEYIQTARSGRDFADKVEAANINGQMFSPGLTAMLQIVTDQEAVEVMKKYLYHVGTQSAHELLTLLGTEGGQQFMIDMIKALKGE